MTVAEARTLLFITDALNDLRKSLRVEQIATFTSALDMPQKILFLEVMGMVLPSDDDEVVWNERRQAWAQLIESAKKRIAVHEDPLRSEVMR